MVPQPSIRIVARFDGLYGNTYAVEVELVPGEPSAEEGRGRLALQGQSPIEGRLVLVGSMKARIITSSVFPLGIKDPTEAIWEPDRRSG